MYLQIVNLLEYWRIFTEYKFSENFLKIQQNKKLTAIYIRTITMLFSNNL